MKGFFRRNLGLKLLSLLLAFILWASVVTQSPEVRWYDVPVRFSTGSERVVTERGASSIRVQLTGSSTILDRIEPDELFAEVDVSHLAPGKHNVTVVPEEIQRVPRGISSIDVDGASFEVEIDARRSVLLPVEVAFAGELAPGLEMAQAVPKPSDVEVTGPAAQIEDLKSVTTEAVDLSTVSGPGELMLKLVLPSPGLRAAPATVRVELQVDELPQPLELTVAVQPSSPGWVSEPPQVKVSLLAPPSLRTRIGGALSATALAEGLPPSGGEVAVTLAWADLGTEEMARLKDVVVEPARVRLRPR